MWAARWLAAAACGAVAITTSAVLPCEEAALARGGAFCDVTAAASGHGGDSIARFDFRNVMRSVTNPAPGVPKDKVTGHVVTLESDAAAHVSVLEPLTGCGGGKGAPVDATARAFRKTRHHMLRLPSACGSAPVFVSSSVFGCRVATNGGLYDTDSFECHGNVVSDGVPVSTSSRMLPHFGVVSHTANGADGVLVGYPTAADVRWLKQQKHAEQDVLRGLAAARASVVAGAQRRSASSTAAIQRTVAQLQSSADADTDARITAMVAGLVWLVRNGTNAVRQGWPQSVEDASIQETGTLDRFVSVASGRNAVGVDARGRLMLAQIDGRTDWKGVGLEAFADFLMGVGMVQGINLDGGGSVTMVRDGHVVNVPSYACYAPGATTEAAVGVEARAADASPPTGGGDEARLLKERDRPPAADDDNFKCQRPVGTVMCIHDDPVVPVVDHTNGGGKLVVERGCVCFKPRGAAPQALPAIVRGRVKQPDGMVDAGFTLEQVAAMVQLGKGRVAARRLASVQRAGSQLPRCSGAAAATDAALCVATSSEAELLAAGGRPPPHAAGERVLSVGDEAADEGANEDDTCLCTLVTPQHVRPEGSADKPLAATGDPLVAPEWASTREHAPFAHFVLRRMPPEVPVLVNGTREPSQLLHHQRFHYSAQDLIDAADDLRTQLLCASSQHVDRAVVSSTLHLSESASAWLSPTAVVNFALIVVPLVLIALVFTAANRSLQQWWHASVRSHAPTGIAVDGTPVTVLPVQPVLVSG